jgi:DNA primase
MIYQSGAEIRRLKTSVLIPSVLQTRGLLGAMKRRGHRLFGPCPIHHGDNPTAFVVDLDRNRWRCFTGCWDSGDVIDLVQRIDHISFFQAVRYLLDSAKFSGFFTYETTE